MRPAALMFTPVCALADIPRLGARVIERAAEHGGNVAVFRTAADRVFALADRCPHKGGPLSQGIVHGDRVACPLHNWNIRLETGAAVEPDVGCAARFPARVENGRVEVALASGSCSSLNSPSGDSSDGATELAPTGV
jgi:nitrite reductase (NADH) small subunit